MKTMNKNEVGFSLVELVVSIGILMILSVGCMGSLVSDFSSYQREAAVQVAVDSVVAAALQNENGFDERYTAETAVEAYNASDAGSVVSVAVERSDDGCLTFEGVFIGKGETASRSLKCD